MNYSSQDSPFLQNHSVYKGMVRVLPTVPPQALLSLRKSGGQFASTPDLSLINARYLQQQPAAPPLSPVPRLPPPPKSSRPRAATTKTDTTSKMGNGQLQYAHVPSFTSNQIIFPPTQPQHPMIPPRLGPAVPSNSTQTHQAKQVPKTNGGGVDIGCDVRKLHDEMVKLKLELAAMNEQMREDDDWMKQQSEQVHQLAQQQRQLQTDMSSISQPQQNNLDLRGKVTPPPLPKSPRPTPQLPDRSLSTPGKHTTIGPIPTFTPVPPLVKGNDESDAVRKLKLNEVKDKVKDEGIVTRRETVVSKLPINRPVSSPEVENVTGPNENTEQNNRNSADSSLSIARNRPKRSSSINVKRISGIFESISGVASTRNTNGANEITKKRQSCGPSISEKFLSPSLPMKEPASATQTESHNSSEQVPTGTRIHRDGRALNPTHISKPFVPIKVEDPSPDNNLTNRTIRPPPIPTSPKPKHMNSNKFFHAHPAVPELETHRHTRTVPIEPTPQKSFIAPPFTSTHEPQLQETSLKSDLPSTPPPPPPLPSTYSSATESYESYVSPDPPPTSNPSLEPLNTSRTLPLSTPEPQETSSVYVPQPPPPSLPPKSNPSFEPEQTHISQPPAPQTSLSPPPPQSSLSQVSPPSPSLSTKNDDRVSLSSLSSASSYSIKASSLRSGSSDYSASKADLMAQIRQFGNSGKILRKAASEEGDDKKSRVRKSSIHTALESRFEAFCGTYSDSGEGESDYEDDDSDNWED